MLKNYITTTAVTQLCSFFNKLFKLTTEKRALCAALARQKKNDSLKLKDTIKNKVRSFMDFQWQKYARIFHLKNQKQKKTNKQK